MADKYGMKAVLAILMQRDGMSREDAEDLLDEACEDVANGQDPEVVVEDYFGLEPDYIWAVL